MWPAMIDEPISPGRGLPVYQPATDVLDGACKVPCAVTPSLITVVRTSMAGMLRATGGAPGPLAGGPGPATAAPDGTTPSLTPRPGANAGMSPRLAQPAMPNTPPLS